MMDAIPNAGPDAMPKTGSIRKIALNLAGRIDNFGVAEKIYSIVALLVILTTFLVVMSIQSVRLQTAYRHLLASSAVRFVVPARPWSRCLDARGPERLRHEKAVHRAIV
jgi:hypothetical protein